VLLVDGAAAVVIILVGVILFTHKPADYNPDSVSGKQISPYLTNRLMPQFYNGLQRGEPFELAIEQKGLNEAITVLGWPQIYNGLIVSTPVAVFGPQLLRLMAQVNYDGIDSVITVEITPQFDSNGLLNLEVVKVKMGALSITFIAKKLAKKMFNEQIQFVEPDNIVALALASLMADKSFEPILEADGKKIKIDRIIIDKQILKIHIIPLQAIPSIGNNGRGGIHSY
jgi:hypothetical protein